MCWIMSLPPATWKAQWGQGPARRIGAHIKGTSMKSGNRDHRWTIGVLLLARGLVFLTSGILALIIHLVPTAGLVGYSFFVAHPSRVDDAITRGNYGLGAWRKSTPDTLSKISNPDSLSHPVYPEVRRVKFQGGVKLKGRFLGFSMGVQKAPNTWNSSDVAVYVTPLRPQARNAVHVTLQRKRRTRSPPFGSVEGDLPWDDARNLSIVIAKKVGRVCVCTELLGQCTRKR